MLQSQNITILIVCTL